MRGSGYSHRRVVRFTTQIEVSQAIIFCFILYFANAVFADTFGWRDVLPGPAPRAEHAIAWDEQRSTLVLFGGSTMPSYDTLDDTWEWDGVRWRRRFAIGPHARAEACMAYDAARREIVLFGGADNYTQFNDTWTWDGRTWTLRAATGPTPRYSAGMVYDRARERMVLFGGVAFDGAYYGDTWEWDGESWELLSTEGPEPRSDHAMTYDAARDRVVVFSGAVDTPGRPRDTWEWDGERWMRIAENSGPAAWGAPRPMAYHHGHSQSILFDGGEVEQNPPATTWAWDGSAWTVAATGGPVSRVRHKMASDGDRRVFVHAGRKRCIIREAYQSSLGDLWSYDGATWECLASSTPMSRSLAGIVTDTTRNVLVVYGGIDPECYFAGGTWEWNGETWRQRAEIGPPLRHYPRMAFDAGRGVTIWFGTSANESDRRMWEWDGVSWTVREPDETWPTDRGQMAYDALRHRLVMLTLSGTWEFDGVHWEHVLDTTPPVCAVVFDGSRGRILGVGCGESAQTWEWDGVAWTNLEVETPTLSFGNGPITFDARRGRVIVVGNAYGSSQSRQTWAWDGVRWQMLDRSNRDLNGNDMIAWDAARELPLMYSYRYGHDDATLVLVRLGDMNCDEHVNALDIDGFVTAIINFEQYETEYTGCEILRGDINDDGVVNMFDIDGFVELLTAE